MKYIKHILPLLAISLCTILILQVFYANMTNYEEKQCWQELENEVEDLSKEIQIKFTDEIAKLHLLETIMVEGDLSSTDGISALHLDKIQTGTMFTRIDVLYPDNTFISNGKKIKLDENISFEKIKTKGEYLSSRKTDFLNGKPCVYYVLPVMKQGEVSAVLIGVIDCETMYPLFKPILYNGEANICIIDVDDGNYIMDNWHDTLGNMYEMEDRELLPEYKNVDFKSDIESRKTGKIAFVSKTTGQNLYMYYAPLDIPGWELAVFTSDDVIFSNLVSLRESFVIAGITEIVLLLLYFFWNVYIIRALQKTNKQMEETQERLEFFSYHDVLTGLFNRHKYIEMLSLYVQNKLSKVGVVFIDLNGLKIINDTHSHEEGDAYICAAANILTQIFGNNVYRMVETNL